MSIRSISIVCAAFVVAVFFAAKSYFQDNLLRGGVFLDGQPLAQADMFFIDDNALNPATRSFARTDAAGRYETSKPLSPGVYRVVVRRLLGQSPDSALQLTEGESAMDEAQQEARVSAMDLQARRQRREATRQASIAVPWRQLPEIYSSPKLTELRVCIPESGPAVFDLHLSLGSIDRIAVGKQVRETRQ